MFNFILWNLDPDILDFGFPRVRYYGWMFVISFILGYSIFKVIFKREKQPEVWLDTLLWYMMIGIIVGARLGHCLFYQPEYYLSHPLEILKVWEGGLASHGAAIGIITALILFSRNVAKKPFLWIMDRIMIVVALGACFIRLGNFTNSEIYGDATNSNYGIVYAHDSKLAQYMDGSEDFQKYVEDIKYEKTVGEPIQNGKAYPVKLKVTLKRSIVDNEQANMVMQFRVKPLLKYGINSEGGESNLFIPDNSNPEINYTRDRGRYVASMLIYAIPKHPTHLYEAFSYLLIFLLLAVLYFKQNAGNRPGLMTGVFMIFAFLARFLIEFIKENQVAKELEMTLNLGQKLSIPFMILGVILIFLAVTGKTKMLLKKY